MTSTYPWYQMKFPNVCAVPLSASGSKNLRTTVTLTGTPANRTVSVASRLVIQMTRYWA